MSHHIRINERGGDVVMDMNGKQSLITVHGGDVLCAAMIGKQPSIIDQIKIADVGFLRSFEGVDVFSTSISSYLNAKTFQNSGLFKSTYGTVRKRR